MLQAVETVAPTDATVLIRGKTGTGKEMLRRTAYVHASADAGNGQSSAPRPGSTVLIANGSELFGYERGASPGRRPAEK